MSSSPSRSRPTPLLRAMDPLSSPRARLVGPSFACSLTTLF